MHFSIEIETNCQEMQKFSDLDEFLDLDWNFLVWKLMSGQNREVSISTEISRLSRRCWDSLFDNVKIETQSRHDRNKNPRLN